MLDVTSSHLLDPDYLAERSVHIHSRTLQCLSDLGHQITVEAPDLSFGLGGVQLIHTLDGGGYVGGSDPRKDGGARRSDVTVALLTLGDQF